MNAEKRVGFHASRDATCDSPSWQRSPQFRGNEAGTASSPLVGGSLGTRERKPSETLRSENRDPSDPTPTGGLRPRREIRVTLEKRRDPPALSATPHADPVGAPSESTPH